MSEIFPARDRRPVKRRPIVGQNRAAASMRGDVPANGHLSQSIHKPITITRTSRSTRKELTEKH